MYSRIGIRSVPDFNIAHNNYNFAVESLPDQRIMLKEKMYGKYVCSSDSPLQMKSGQISKSNIIFLHSKDEDTDKYGDIFQFNYENCKFSIEVVESNVNQELIDGEIITITADNGLYLSRTEDTNFAGYHPIEASKKIKDISSKFFITKVSNDSIAISGKQKIKVQI